MPKPTSAADPTPVRVVVVTMDSHLASAMERAEKVLRRRMPGPEQSTLFRRATASVVPAGGVP